MQTSDSQGQTATADPSRFVQVVITSFGYGYGHGPAPEADLTIDARRHLRNPHADPAIWYLTGLDPAVHYHVLTTPGARGNVRSAVTFATNLLADTATQQLRLVTIAVGCVGGRHRAVDRTTRRHTERMHLGRGVKVTHLHAHLPRVLETANT